MLLTPATTHLRPAVTGLTLLLAGLNVKPDTRVWCLGNNERQEVMTVTERDSN